jgi:hypothetical protein
MERKYVGVSGKGIRYFTPPLTNTLTWTNILFATNALAYCGICKLRICSVFIVQAPEAWIIKLVTAVINSIT